MAEYRTIRQIGRGGFGIVEEVEDENGNRFAKKIFSPSGIQEEHHEKLRKRFKREVIIQQKLGGPEILPVIEHDLNSSFPWFVMPLAASTYQEQIKLDKAEGKVEIGPIADIINGLQRLHSLGYVHRDLNPNNILCHEGVWKLSDLGAVLPPSGHTTTLTEDTVIFTERYCAPEQRMDFHSAQPPADVYSFGCILHDIFSNSQRTPYMKHTAEGKIGLIIEKCTEHNPDRRPSLNALRSLVLDTLFEEGGHCKVEDEQAEAWLEKLEQINDWTDEDFLGFGRFFAGLDIEDRTEGHENEWVYSLSTPFLTRIPVDVLKKVVERNDGIAEAILEKYCEWAGKTSFAFNFADNISIRLALIFDHGTPSNKAYSFTSLVKLAAYHNRWFVMRTFLSRCNEKALSPELAKRLAVEIQAEELIWEIRKCMSEIKYDESSIHPEIMKVLS